jgi:hypothetical protein
MARERLKTDHAFLELKLLIRSRLVREVAPRAVVDFFAGEGRIMTRLYGGFATVHAVDKDPVKLARFCSENTHARTVVGAGPRACPRPGRPRGDAPTPHFQDCRRPEVKVYAMDNREFCRIVLPSLSDVTFMDFDAYGNPHPLIALAFDHHRVRERTAVAVTDGGRLALLRGQRITPASYLAAAPDPRLARTRSLSAFEYELLVRGFWKELAKKHGLAASNFTASWAKGRRVMYYGLIIAPA